MKTKQELRQKIKSKLKNLEKKTIEKKSKSIFEKLKKYTDDFQIRFIFLSTESEFQTQELIKYLWEKGKTVLVPSIDKNNKMQVVIYDKNTSLKVGKFGILEVENIVKYGGVIDIAIVPGLAFTKDGKRLGKGKGYYDRFFSKNNGIFKIGVCFEEQVVDNLFVERHDIDMDIVIYN